MDDTKVQGQLRISSTTLDADLAFIRGSLKALSEPKPIRTAGTGEIRFWQVEFATTRAQWRVVAPELDERGILATIYEEAHLADLARREEEARLAKISRHSRSNLLTLLGAAILFIGWVSFAFLHSECASFAIVALGILLVATAFTARSMRDERDGY